VAICFGQEAEGISKEILDISYDTVSIPMKGATESLNVAVAAGIVMAFAAGVLDL
jgi:TrmH family RNA methyltransferase